MERRHPSANKVDIKQHLQPAGTQPTTARWYPNYHSRLVSIIIQLDGTQTTTADWYPTYHSRLVPNLPQPAGTWPSTACWDPDSHSLLVPNTHWYPVLKMGKKNDRLVPSEVYRQVAT